MKIFYFSDDNFLDMKTNFELSFKEEFDKQFKFVKNINIDRNKPGSGVDIWKFKTEMILDAIKQNINDIIIISDIDIIFYKPVIPIILENMTNNDICFQKESQNSGLNIGFISIFCNMVLHWFCSETYETIKVWNS
jgi:hypothetical protein